MRLKVFTLGFDPTTGRFDDSEAREFLAEREALHVFEHFFTFDGVPIWALLVTYRDPAEPGAARVPRARPEPASELSESDRALYEALRRWRNDRARRDGRPAYILFNNRQLADIARLRPNSVVALQEVPGVGEGKARSYGEDVLALLAAAPAMPDPPPAEDTSATG